MQKFYSILETSNKTRKPKEEIKKERQGSIINGQRHENKGLDKKALKLKVQKLTSFKNCRYNSSDSGI